MNSYINKLCIGTVQMGIPYGINNTQGKIPPVESHEILKKAFASGIRLLDTAESYGNAHQLIGDFHVLNPKKRFKVITKIPSNDKIRQIEEKVIDYLNTLNISRLEGLLFHSFQSYKNNRDIIHRLVSLKRKGLIKQLGVSIYTNNELKELLIDDQIDLIQMPFNLLDNFSMRGELMQEAKNKQKTIHTRSAFLQGLFFKNPLDNHPVVHVLQKQLIEIHKISNEKGLSIASLALAYCMQQPCIDQVLIGVDSIKQLIFNLEASKCRLPEDVIQLINQIYTENKSLLNPSLWKKMDYPAASRRGHLL